MPMFVVCLFSVLLHLSSGETACVGDEAQCNAIEEASLLSIHPRKRQASISSDNSEGAGRWVECPGTSAIHCRENSCCPGTPSSSNKTFPCPNSARDFECEGGRDALVSALLGALSRTEKYRFVRGVGWGDGSYENLRGFYIGDAALHERFGVPALNMEDNGQGFRTTDKAIIDQVTSWPETLAITASWSEKDTERFAVALGKEFRRKGANVILGPGVNVARVARGGRNGEYISGESAYLGARLVKPYVRGVQSQKVLAVVKHLGFNNQEDDRDHVNSIIDDRTMWETYYPPFEAAVEAGVAAAMCSYNLVNGVHACGNADLLVKDFKGTMGFKGWVQTDWWALHDFAADQGVDQEMPGTRNPNSVTYFHDENLDTLSDSKIDSMVRPQLTMMLKYGLFEPAEDQDCQPPKCDRLMYGVNATSEEHQALSKELATKSVMLLKNNGVLPFGTGAKKIAVLGSACDAPQNVDAQLRQWDLGSYYNIGGSGRVIAWDPVSILAGLSSKCKENGCQIVTHLTDDSASAIRAAQDSDVAVICAGTSSTEGHDRASLSVDQEQFMVEVAAGLSIPVVSLTMTPAAVVMPWAGSVDAVVNIFLAGKYTGTAFADVLFGDSNPSAKTPITFPLSEADTVLPCSQIECPYSEGLMAGWHGLQDKAVLFPFGHGLSYTTFDYSKLSINVDLADMPADCAGAEVYVTALVTNAGKVGGVEVAQLYLGHPAGIGEPAKVLRGFVRTGELKPGASADVVFPLFLRDLQVFNPDANGWEMPNGDFGIFVGSSSRDLRLTSGFSICNGAISMDQGRSCQ